MKPKKEKIVADPIDAAVLAQAIRDIGAAVSAMNKAGLAFRAQVLLISDASGVCKFDVKRVLAGMSQLKRLYLTDGT